ncbi:helix-turn-helix transcriptional regulator [Iamia majanohamensis]|uniref:Helix-turn-helix transcriptional regulator n=1 Tax=Iamia majanohamensis TaxID=467976 RepID=A0AAF0BX85_9ACTN|nr:helix-turn-helix transcriptional regulator [Iamia majanohamensis]WCO68723.1 helix-turn-helix transcriptional regulator [Iamia majanohamensis]
MDTAETLRQARLGARLTLRALARRAGTSHATLAAYESGRTSPGAATLVRVLGAAGYDLDVALRTRPAEPEARGRELEAVLDLAEEFPARHDPVLRAPVFGRS